MDGVRREQRWQEGVGVMHLLSQALTDIYAALDTDGGGLNSADAARRLASYGNNTLGRRERLGGAAALLRLFLNPLVLVLLVSAVLSYYLGERSGAVIIAVIVTLSVLLQFYHEHRSGQAAAALSHRVAVRATVRRDGAAREVPLTEVVPGDVVQLGAGDIIPGDARLIAAKDLYVNQAALTGESYPVAKRADAAAQAAATVADMDYAVFMGSSVTSGLATALVVHTGAATQIGHIAHSLTAPPPETEFQRGIREFSLMLVRVIFALVLAIFFINAVLKHNFFESFLFAVAVSVGLTPELLPMILTVNLANGAVAMARHGVIVKWLTAIQNFGSMDILCSDKTGTLTEGEMRLAACTDTAGAASETVRLYAYLNSTMQGGLKNPLDLAIAAAGAPAAASDYVKVDEVPFDFVRRMLSVVVARPGERLLIAKGAPESILPRCASCLCAGADAVAQPFAAAQRESVQARFAAASAQGYKVIAVAYRRVDAGQASYTAADERDMTLAGMLTFFDPPKAGVREAIAGLKELGVRIKVLTGDNELVAAKVCGDVGIPAEQVVTGAEVALLSDEALAHVAEHTAVFARLTPEQKNRVMYVLRRRGHVVGFLGDGINDAPSLRAADVGISVDNAVDVAKESASLILLEKSLDALQAGVVEGRRTFANTMKYIMMGTSSNFGNMFSMAVASAVVPFLPLQPVQILLNNLLYDVSQLTIPTDRVDDDDICRPRRWDIRFIRRFMLVFGPVSSLFDMLTFGVLLYAAHAGESLFQTGWFMESLATQVLVIHVIRSRRSILRSRAGRWLALSTSAAVAAGLAVPYTVLGGYFGFVPLPLPLLAAMLALTAAYLVLAELAKRWFYRHISEGRGAA